jgi:hypothetical protein
VSQTQVASSTGQNILDEMEALRKLDQEFSSRVGETRPSDWRAIWQNIEGQKCFSYQPDGVPCGSVEIDCEHCQDLLTSLQRWRGELEAIMKRTLAA